MNKELEIRKHIRNVMLGLTDLIEANIPPIGENNIRVRKAPLDALKLIDDIIERIFKEK